MLTTASYLSILRAYWRASGELAEVESQHKGDFEMQAHRDFIALEKTLKAYLTAWNDDVPEGESKITECSKVGQESKCELYFAEDQPTMNTDASHAPQSTRTVARGKKGGHDERSSYRRTGYCADPILPWPQSCCGKCSHR